MEESKMRAGTAEWAVETVAVEASGQRRLQRRHHHCLKPLCSTQMRIPS